MTTGPEFISIAICSVGEVGASLDACLAALSAAGVASPIVLEASGGMASLRNEALVRCKTPVLAFVDDDVVVEPDWLEVMAAAWSRAPANVACIGGPIVARSHPDSPGWFADSLAGVVCANTPSVDDPLAFVTTETFCGGNVSFRTDALRGVEGFWPVRGAGRLRDWFSEEHHAQRELQRAGWGAVMVDRLAASRIIGSPASLPGLASAQAVAGARRRMIGGGNEREVKAALRSAAGALIALSRLDRELAAERVVRAAGHAGTAAPRIARRTLEPTSSSTPFRHSVPNETRRAPRGPRGAATYCYHRVSDEAIPSSLAVSTADFRSQLEELISDGDPASAVSIADGTAKRNSFAITFDDGYADNLYVALPILEEFGVPATFFVTSGHVIDQKGFWWDRLYRLLDAAAGSPLSRGVLRLECEGEVRSWAPTGKEELRRVGRHLNSWLQSKPPEAIEQTLIELERWTGPSAAEAVDRPMTPRELREMSAHPLVTIGAHTRSHANLRFCEPSRLNDEMAGARADLEELVGREVTAVAYAFGVWGSDVDEATVEAARTAGYQTGFLNGGRPLYRDPLATPRAQPVP